MDTPSTSDDTAREAATAIVARARAECVRLGLSPAAFAQLLLDEAVLALIIDGHDEAAIRAALARTVDATAIPWLAQLRHKAGMCDCVAEVHLAAIGEARCERGASRG